VCLPGSAQRHLYGCDTAIVWRSRDRARFVDRNGLPRVAGVSAEPLDVAVAFGRVKERVRQ